MPRYHAQRVLPYTAEQMFDLVADVESYPAFVPWWQEARIITRTPSLYRTDQILGLGPVRLHFGSETRLIRPESIHVTARGGGLRQLTLTWGFEPHPQGSLTRLDMGLEMATLGLDRLVGHLSREAAKTLVEAFANRARSLYGRHGRFVAKGDRTA
ncbi:type II toxin-antitoxin system RatA family toxin [Pararhodospirillum oryzae]|uniref:Ubiquinone-binding protein n=1 Tax=Pararhodospirillum oryzae TaxID=478448 RepID=A0A512H4E4_9PROT|nr:type II toxin-antitoxin system RatA family toxin [Pararhodospirillum oryzae]GEO80346.1 ubiquinone-binding protein [Pararhodospirillum oryzae]